MHRELSALLRGHGIQPSAQRLAVAQYVLHTDAHPTADEVWARVKERFPTLSRATVYNTLHLFAEKGLLRELALADGAAVFDPKMERHHHFIDEETGAIFDVPWGSVRVSEIRPMPGYDVNEYQVVMRGQAKRRR